MGLLALALTAGVGLLGWMYWPHPQGAVLPARATVLTTAQCGGPEARDSVRVELPDGRELPARLDGCGNLPGEVLSVEVPDPPPPGTPVVRLAGTGVPTTATPAQRISTVLVAAAGMAGAVLAWRLRPVRR